MGGQLGQDPFLRNAESVERLRASRLAAVFEASDDAFFDVDVAARTITWSRGMTLIFGHDPERLGRRLDAWQALVHPDDAEAVASNGSRLITSGAPSWVQRFRFRRADGRYAHVRVRSIMVREDERPSHIVGALTDVTDVRELEEELRQTVDQLTRAILIAGRGPSLPENDLEAPRSVTLTDRQRLVLALIREGRTNKEIASALSVSEQAAKAQVRKLMQKYGVANRAALAAIRVN